MKSIPHHERAMKAGIRVLAFLLCVCVGFLIPSTGWAQPVPPSISFPGFQVTGQNSEATILQIVALMTVLSMAPAILLMLTSFTRIFVVLGFIRHAIGLQQMPPNQVLASLALFLTFFSMAPVWDDVYKNALIPFTQGKLSSEIAIERSLKPVRAFMFRQTREKELGLMLRLSKQKQPQNQEQVATHILVPAYVISELKTAFQMGVVLFIPFIVVDMIVASILMSMGMMMLPPSMISLPFKVLLFTVADGWNLVISSLITSIR